MRADNPAALRFILQDDIYLLPGDKTLAGPATSRPVADVLPEAASLPPAEPVSHPVVQTPAVQFNYLGKNKKAFLIITHYTGHDFIDDVHLTALQNILKRKEHELDDIAIFNMAKNRNAALDELLSYFKPQRLLILGKDALPANMEALALNELKDAGGYTALYSFSFDEMMDSTAHKKAFWDQMKNL
ncbi:hypothetical protein [Mucilaginibacter sp. UR6-11]|uniref:hypothetical protein n=1 Tax=Mucilaginibacter sp. UR6-11 TaxID=1435644 RepID=UPI001E4C406A|nr:hypothetical protein [Mucilaginibacter sp. UR6-11]MCC8424786.1 hypothetical protein [Mucilaginibacter sp. UR6-11]